MIDVMSVFGLGLEIYILLLSYILLGGGIKFIDAAFDEGSFNKTIAVIVAVPISVLWVGMMMIDPYSATLLLSIVFGVLLKGKIDNAAHFIGLIVILLMITFLKMPILWLPLIFLTASALFDEVGNDISDYNSGDSKIKRFWQDYLVYFFGRRYFLKLSLLFLILIGQFPMYLLLSLILFDETYLLVGIWSDSRSLIVVSD